MALQGTLETFALPDVLRLLASTKKTGCSRLAGDCGAGRLYVRDGQIVAGDVAASPAVTDPSEVAFELLRFEDGEFRFQADAMPAHETSPQDVESVLDAADRMLLEWRDIESIVPSLETWVSLRAELPADEVTIRADKWVTLVAVGSGCSVGQLGSVLGLGELPVSRLVRDLLDLGVVELHEAPQPSAAEGYGGGYQQPTYTEPDYGGAEYPAESYEETSYEQGTRYDESPYQEPSYQEGYQQPVAYQDAAYEQPGYQEPYEQPAAYQESYDQQPSYEQAGYQESYEPTGYQEPAAPGYDEGGYEDQYNDPRYATAAYDPMGGDGREAGPDEYGYDEQGGEGKVIGFPPYGDAHGGYDNGSYEAAGYENGAYENGSYETYDTSALVIDDSRGGEAPYLDDRYAANPPPPPTRTTSYEPTTYDTDPTDAAEIARQLANLSPRAAKAVAAAAKATTQAEREAALAQVDESEDSINRELLLKFLGSVNS